jgi:hypothetical protein
MTHKDLILLVMGEGKGPALQRTVDRHLRIFDLPRLKLCICRPRT